jgi:hypothetical protein
VLLIGDLALIAPDAFVVVDVVVVDAIESGAGDGTNAMPISDIDRVLDNPRARCLDVGVVDASVDGVAPVVVAADGDALSDARTFFAATACLAASIHCNNPENQNCCSAAVAHLMRQSLKSC